MLKIKVFQFNPFGENTWVLSDATGEAVVVDPGCFGAKECKILVDYLQANALRPVAIWLTHAHVDHVCGVAPLLAALAADDATYNNIPVRMAAADRPMIDHPSEIFARLGISAGHFATQPVADGDTVSFGDTQFRVIATPGHTPGCVCYYDAADKKLLTGDTLFAGAIGRTDLDGGDYDSLILSIMNRLMDLPGDVDILPGHGDPSDIGWERTHNPFLQPFNEPEDLAALDGDEE